MNKVALIFASCREELDRNQKKIHNKCNKNWFLCIKLYRKGNFVHVFDGAFNDHGRAGRL